jgi:hypothetical protein
MAVMEIVEYDEDILNDVDHNKLPGAAQTELAKNNIPARAKGTLQNLCRFMTLRPPFGSC